MSAPREYEEQRRIAFREIADAQAARVAALSTVYPDLTVGDLEGLDVIALSMIAARKRLDDEARVADAVGGRS